CQRFLEICSSTNCLSRIGIVKKERLIITPWELRNRATKFFSKVESSSSSVLDYNKNSFNSVLFATPTFEIFNHPLILQGQCPSGLNARGASTVSLRTSTIRTTPTSLQVNEDSGLTAMGIVAPTDSKYLSTQLTVTVTGLPTDGTVFLSDGTTRVYAGEKLTISQLTGLMFRPTSGLFGTTSAFKYSVTDPSGNKAVGAAKLSIAPDSMPPLTTPVSVTVAENAGPTPINIVAPTDPNYSTSQLTVKVTGLPSDGLILLPDGVTKIAIGTVLTVGQLTGLLFQPASGTFNTSSQF